MILNSQGMQTKKAPHEGAKRKTEEQKKSG